MKNLTLIIIALFFVVNPVLCQTKLVIGPEYQSRKDTLFRANIGDTIIINTEPIFLVNEDRFKLYHDMHQGVKGNKLNLLFTQFQVNIEEELKLRDEKLGKILILNEESKKVSDEILEKTTVELKTTKDNLLLTKDKLSATQLELEEARNNINKAKLQKFLFGLGGVAVGILTGVLISGVN